MVHRSLLAADNALGLQSERHPDGWGVAFYVDGSPHVTKSAATALHDSLFQRVSGIVSSETVLAHVRKATVGDLSVLNSHPFQYGRWVFAHNGDIPRFSEVKERLVVQIAPKLRRFVLGDTDSEIVFFLFLTALEERGALASDHGVDAVMDAVRDTVRLVRAAADQRPDLAPSLLTFIATNGSALVATRGGRELHWSTYKGRCADRESCASLAYECEHPTETGHVNHLILSSEPLGGENVWTELGEDQLIGVGADMRLRIAPLSDKPKRLPVVP
jgi:predicted glutamine amidotransferase